jgi:hypothetical protein
LNFILSFTLWDKGFDEPIPIERSNKKCQADNAEMGKGIKKCKLKNLLKVALPTRNPPHNQQGAVSPTRNIRVEVTKGNYSLTIEYSIGIKISCSLYLVNFQ